MGGDPSVPVTAFPRECPEGAQRAGGGHHLRQPLPGTGTPPPTGPPPSTDPPPTEPPFTPLPTHGTPPDPPQPPPPPLPMGPLGCPQPHRDPLGAPQPPRCPPTAVTRVVAARGPDAERAGAVGRRVPRVQRAAGATVPSGAAAAPGHPRALSPLRGGDHHRGRAGKGARSRGRGDVR